MISKYQFGWFNFSNFTFFAVHILQKLGYFQDINVT